MTTTLQSSPYLPRQRNFPNNSSQELGVTLDKAYVEIASRVNERIIGLYPVNFVNITGEKFYFNSTPQQSLRRIYTFTAAGNFPHGILWSDVSKISHRSYGSYLDTLGNWNGVIYASSIPIPGQVTFYVTPVSVFVVAGAGAPPISSGYIDLEFISNV